MPKWSSYRHSFFCRRGTTHDGRGKGAHFSHLAFEEASSLAGRKMLFEKTLPPGEKEELPHLPNTQEASQSKHPKNLSRQGTLHCLPLY